ncbi:MAG: diguanylate cyclase [Polaromonas sp.]|nr:diguanylate cyclase [Polaromonas sp.]
MVAQWLIRTYPFRALPVIPDLLDIEPNVDGLAALSIFATSTYLAMVWFSRSRAENALRVEARERTDPLTGLATQRVFLDRVDGGLLRSRNLGYACALILIRVDNIEKVAADRNLDNNEAVILAASRAIAKTLRAQNTAARLSGNRFGVMAEGIAEGSGTELATKIVAQGLRAGECGLRGSELQFQIAVIEVVQPEIDSTALFQQLEEVLRQMTSQSSPNRIRTLARITGRQAV